MNHTPILDQPTAEAILKLLKDVRNDQGELCSLSAREIRLRDCARAALTHWQSQAQVAV